MSQLPQTFFWYELMTTDIDAAEDFYSKVVGWTGQRWGVPDTAYCILNAGEQGVAGLMLLSEAARERGEAPGWIGYIYAQDVDAATRELAQAGGTVHRPPADIAGIGRFAVVADPQGAPFMLMTPHGPDRPVPPPMTPGHVGWHELYASDWPAAFDFYAGQFGWTKAEAFDMGPMGTYQLFAPGGDAIGGMMNKPDEFTPTAWLYYFNVGDIAAAAESVTRHGGQIMMGPDQVPGGGWIVQCTDPQGARFALSGPNPGA